MRALRLLLSPLLLVLLTTSGCFLVTPYPGQYDPNSEIDADGDGVFADVDCDDANADRFQGNPEVCDGLDNDCSNGPDFDAAGEVDADFDGFLSCAECDDA